MKKLLALLGGLAAVSLIGQTPPATTSTTTPTVVTPTPPAPAPKPPAKPVEKEQPPIPGIVLQRGNGNQLGLTIDNGSFKLSFFDKKRKPILSDVTRARAVWNPPYKAIPEQTMLNIVDNGKALGGGKPVRPPYAFKLRLTLLKGDGDAEQAVENYTVDFTDAAVPKK